jgi:glycine/D-amino acid oxidase-like deaminating enzyme
MMYGLPAASDAAAPGRAPTARIIGAGPAGVLASGYLAKHGWEVITRIPKPARASAACTASNAHPPATAQVHTYDKRPSPLDASASSRNYSLFLGEDPPAVSLPARCRLVAGSLPARCRLAASSLL